MSFFDKAKDKLSDAVDKHGDKINQGLDKAAAAVDKKTGGKHTDKISQGVARLVQALADLVAVLVHGVAELLLRLVQETHCCLSSRVDHGCAGLCRSGYPPAPLPN